MEINRRYSYLGFTRRNNIVALKEKISIVSPSESRKTHAEYKFESPNAAHSASLNHKNAYFECLTLCNLDDGSCYDNAFSCI